MVYYLSSPFIEEKMKETANSTANTEILRFTPDENAGLSPEQVASRFKDGLYNRDAGIKTKSIKRILFENAFTFFNILNLVLDTLVLMVGSIKNALFMGVVIGNMFIGAYQAIRSKLTIDKLSLITAPKATVIRGGKVSEIAVNELVLDDIMLLSAGKQICSDGTVLSGECEVNESLLTGESEPVVKRRGDELFSGSFIVSGDCKAQVQRVGEDNYSSTIVGGAKHIKQPNSEIRNSLDYLVKTISVILIPIGLILFVKAYFLSNVDIQQSVVSSVAAILGMIPSGVVLLTSIVFAVSVIRLSGYKTLVQQLYCCESLARVNVLCLDKTGTITEGTMQVDDIIPIGGSSDDAAVGFSALAAALSDNNETFNAVKARFGNESQLTATKVFPFSSARKWSGANFGEEGCYVMGAGEFILGEGFDEISGSAKSISEMGRRVLLLAHSKNHIDDSFTLPADLQPIAMLAISDKIRDEAPDTLKFFREQGVDLKIISGDNALTVSHIARRAGFADYENYCDASTLLTDEDAENAILKHSIFGRVTPHQKLLFVKALKKNGKTVAMTGDGVNDVLALKESDCGVAMASGAEAARTVADIVLLDSNFASMPKVVREGRRSINNLERSAALYFSKTGYAIAFGILFIFLAATYPFSPINMTLVSSLTIGFPSFVLAMEPNTDLVRGVFLANALKRSLPSSIVMTVGVLFLSLSMGWLGISQEELSTLSVMMAGAAGFMLMVRLSIPYNKLRAALLVVTVVAFCGCFAIPLLRELFMLCTVTPKMLTIIAPLVAVLGVAYIFIDRFVEKFVSKHEKKFSLSINKAK